MEWRRSLFDYIDGRNRSESYGGAAPFYSLTSHSHSSNRVLVIGMVLVAKGLSIDHLGEDNVLFRIFRCLIYRTSLKSPFLTPGFALPLLLCLAMQRLYESAVRSIPPNENAARYAYSAVFEIRRLMVNLLPE